MAVVLRGSTATYNGIGAAVYGTVPGDRLTVETSNLSHNDVGLRAGDYGEPPKRGSTIRSWRTMTPAL
jgi:hypothetical protein